MIVCAVYSQSDADTICIPKKVAIDLYNERVTGQLCDTQRSVLLQRIDVIEEQKGELVHQVDALKRAQQITETLNQDCESENKELKRQNVAQRLVTRIVIMGAVIAEVGTIYLFVR